MNYNGWTACLFTIIIFSSCERIDAEPILEEELSFMNAGATLIAFKTAGYSFCMEGEYTQTGEFICKREYSSPTDETEFILDIKGSPNVMGTMSFGYRRIPVEGGFTWRANLTPIFNNNGFWPLFAGIGVGYAF